MKSKTTKKKQAKTTKQAKTATAKATATKPVYVCAVCGSENVQHAMWVAVNTGDVNDDFGSWCAGDNSWCDDCEEHTGLVARESLVVKLKPTTKASRVAELLQHARESQTDETPTTEREDRMAELVLSEVGSV